MKAVTTILKVLAALAAIAGVVYVVATYGDKIVAWAKKLLGCGDSEFRVCDCDCGYDDDCSCESQVEEAPAEQSNVVAEEKDFEG